MKFAVTETGTLLRCERKAWLTSKNGLHLEPIKSPLYFQTGSLVHAAHQQWMLDPNRDLEAHLLDAAVKAQSAIQQKYLRLTGTMPDESELATTYEAVEFALAMCRNYQKRWVTPLPPEYRLLYPEQKIQVEVPGTAHPCEACDGRGVVDNGEDCEACHGGGSALHILEGKLDALIQHVETSHVGVLERKTYAARPAAAALRYNDQFTGYAWLVYMLGINPAGIVPEVLYDGSWRRAEVPRGKSFNDLFYRYIIPITQHELDEYGLMLSRRLNNAAALYRNPGNHTKHREWNGSCSWSCGVQAICEAMTLGEDYGAVIRGSYTERTDDAEDESEDG